VLFEHILRGYLLSVALETPVLLVGLSRWHSLRRKLFAGFWLTALSYPVVTIAFPRLIDPMINPLGFTVLAEVFAPAIECAAFWYAYQFRKQNTTISWRRDCIAIIMANLFSFAVGEMLKASGFSI
jgi:hypothetical protein